MNIHINEPWWGAYKQFGWGEKIPGIGFKKDLVDTLVAHGLKEKIVVTIGKDPTKYQISPVTIQHLAEKYKSTYHARYDTILYVIPQNELRKV